MTGILENKTFDEIDLGQSASLTRALRYEDLETWAAVTGNVALVDAVEIAAREGLAKEGSAFGMWGTSLFSTIIGTQLPGAGTMIRSANVSFQRPLVIGAQMTATVTVTGKNSTNDSIILECRCCDTLGDVFISGTAEVIAPKKRSGS